MTYHRDGRGSAGHCRRCSSSHVRLASDSAPCRNWRPCCLDAHSAQRRKLNCLQATWSKRESRVERACLRGISCEKEASAAGHRRTEQAGVHIYNRLARGARGGPGQADGRGRPPFHLRQPSRADTVFFWLATCLRACQILARRGRPSAPASVLAASSSSASPSPRSARPGTPSVPGALDGLPPTRTSRQRAAVAQHHL